MKEEIKCNICKATFKSEEHLTDGKCDMCEKLWPGAKSKEEIRKPEDVKKNEGNVKNIVKKELNKLLLDYGILLECDCGKLFYKKSPAHKSCGECSGGSK